VTATADRPEGRFLLHDVCTLCVSKALFEGFASFQLQSPITLGSPNRMFRSGDSSLDRRPITGVSNPVSRDSGWWY
jgi:hypothetical protein